MGTIEIVGYVRDGEIWCAGCAHKEHEQENKDSDFGDTSFKDYLKYWEMEAVTDLEDFGPEGYYCDCGAAIQESYCPKCGNATGTYGEICENCRIDKEDEKEADAEMAGERGSPICPKCGGPMTEGNFENACRACDKVMFERCRICGAPRIFCCC